MTLANYQPERAEVPIKGGALSVRGLSLDDLGLLVRAHYADFEALFALYKQAVESGPASGDAMARVLLTFVQEAPDLCATIVALAADEPGQAATVKRLPFPVIVDAMSKIGRLTFEDIGGPEPFINALASLVGGLRRPTSATTASSTTTAASGPM